MHQRHLRNKSFNYLLAGARALNATLQAAGTAAVLYLSCTYPLASTEEGGESRTLSEREENTVVGISRPGLAQLIYPFCLAMLDIYHARSKPSSHNRPYRYRN